MECVLCALKGASPAQVFHHAKVVDRLSLNLQLSEVYAHAQQQATTG
jgi:hypothetical protein